jgi:hypothetical protein
MGKKRAREADGAPPDKSVDKMDEDSGSDEVSFHHSSNGRIRVLISSGL